MTSKRAYLQNVTVLLNSTNAKGVYLNKIIVCSVFFCHNDHMENALRKTQIENIDVQFARAFLSKLPLT